MWGVETKWRRLKAAVRGTKMVSLGLEVILQIWWLGGNFCGAHGAEVLIINFFIYLIF